MATFNWYEMPPSQCERCGDEQFDSYCYGEIVFDDGDTLPVCYSCFREWYSCLLYDERGCSVHGPDGNELYDPVKVAAFQRRGVESYQERHLREWREQDLERRAAAQDD